VDLGGTGEGWAVSQGWKGGEAGCVDEDEEVCFIRIVVRGKVREDGLESSWTRVSKAPHLFSANLKALDTERPQHGGRLW